jgi:hypothetical protein
MPSHTVKVLARPYRQLPSCRAVAGGPGDHPRNQLTRGDTTHAHVRAGQTLDPGTMPDSHLRNAGARGISLAAEGRFRSDSSERSASSEESGSSEERSNDSLAGEGQTGSG